MKHLKTIFACLLMAVLSIGQVWATDVSGSISLGNTTGAWNATTTASFTDENDLSWSRTYSSGNKQSIQGGICQFGNSSNACTSLVFTTTIGQAVTLSAFSANFVGGASKTSGTIKLYSGTTELATATVSGTASVTCQISSSASVGASDAIKVEYTGTNGSIKISQIAYTYTTGGGGAPTPTLSSVAVSGTPSTTAYENGDAFDATGLTVTGTYSDSSTKPETAGVTWTACKTENGTYVALDNAAVALATNETGIYVKATVGEKTSPAYHVTGLTVTAPLPKITITQTEVASFTNSYAQYTWTAGGVSGKLYAYKNSGMQFNSGKDGYYVYNTDPIPGKIRKITMTKASGTTRSWTPYVSTSAMTSTEGGTALTAKDVETTTTWDVTGDNSYFYLTVAGGSTVISSIVITYEEVEATQVATPEISGTENFYPETTVSISCGTDGAAIYYTTNGSTPTSASTLYEGAFTVSANGTTTVKAIAIKDGLTDSEVASKAFTKATPLSTMDAIFAAASTPGNQIITFSNTWVVTGVSTNGKNAYLTDGTKGLILFNTSASSGSPVAGLAKDKTLSGTVTRNLTLYNSAAELTDFTADGLTIGDGTTPDVRELDAEGIAALSAVNTGSLIKISGQCIYENSKYYIKYGSGDNDKVQVYNVLYAFGSLTANANYEVTGVFIQYNTTKEIAPRSADDIEQEVVKNQPETQWNATAKTVRVGDATTGWWSTSSDGAKSFSSSNTSVATITNAGVITLVAPGTTTLTFSTAETGTYYAGNASLTLTVKAALPAGGTEFTWDATAQSYEDQTVIETVTAAPNPIIAFANTGSNAPKWYNNGSAVRFYKDNSITITAPENKLLYQVEINFVSGNVKTLTTDVEEYSLEGTVGTWSGLAKKVVFSNGDGAARITSINVIYADGTVTTLSIANVAMKTTDEPLQIVPTCNVTPTPAISYEIATADQVYATIENGIITPLAVTSSPISVTATIAEGANYTAASTTFTITVSEKQMPTLSFPEVSYDANLGSTFTAPTLTNPENVTVAYSSSEEGVATVNASTGAIELVGEGTTVITAAFAGNGDYAANSAFYTLNVADPNKDVLTAAGIGKTSYENWSDKTFTSGVKYAGNNTTGTGTYAGTIQMRTSSNSGIVSTSTIGYLKSISVTATKNGANSLNIYAKNTAYESSADLYDNDKRGTLIGTISNEGGAMVFEEGKAYSDNYKYIGIKANGGAVYYDDIIITWEPAVFTTYSVTYEAGDATGDDVVIDNIEDGTPITLQDNPYTYEGHVFAGWSDGENIYQAGDDYTVNGNVTFTAQWAEQFNVTYNPGEAGGDAIVRTVAAGAYNLEAGSIFTYAGHAFDGWMKDETKYNAGASYPISENVAFTAQWVEAPDPVTVTFVAGTDKSETMSLIKDGISLSYEASSGTFNRDDDYRCYSGKTLTIASEVGNITNIEFTLTQNTFTTETGTYENGSWNGSAESIVFTTSGGQVRMTQISVTYIPNGNTPKQPAGLSYDQTSYTIAQNEGFTAPTVNNPNDLVVTYSGNNDDVATVNAATGAITLGEATGVVTITATAEAQGNYLAGTASYTLTVNAPIVIDDLSGTWELVTDASQLVAGKKVIIASVPDEGAAVTMSTTQATNNRIGLAGATVSEGAITAQNGTAVFTIEAGTEENTIAFKSSANEYLYAASSGSNYIRSQETNNANGSWIVTISEGVATITAQGENTRNVIRYNPNTAGDNPLFACYASSSTTGTLITLYMLREDTPEPPTPSTPDYTRTVEVNRYGTICLPNGGTISGATLFDLEYYDGASTLYLLEVNGNAMVAGRPYIFLPNETSIEVTYTDDANVTTAGSFNGLVGSLANTNVLVEANAGNYILYENAYYLVNSTAYVGANRAYIHMEDVPDQPTPQLGAAPRRRVAMTVNGTNTATDIDAINASEKPMKLMIDGNIYILRGEKMYDVTGKLLK